METCSTLVEPLNLETMPSLVRYTVQLLKKCCYYDCHCHTT